MPLKREVQMYRAIKRYFVKHIGCKAVFADLPDEKKKIHLPRNLSKRDPDVIGAGDDKEIFVAEGKMLSQSGQPFEQCVEQLLSLKAFADHLYAFFPNDDWERLTKDDADRNRKILKAKGIGLILVDERGHTRAVLPATSNDAEESKKNEVLRILGLVKDTHVPSVDYLSSSDAALATKMICLVDDLGREIGQEAVAKVFSGKKHRFVFDTFSHENGGNVFRCAAWPGHVGFEFDPFGAYLGDGRPCIWIGRNMSDGFLLNLLEAESPAFGTHVWFGDKDETLPLQDVTPERVKQCDNMWLEHRIEFFGRSRDGLKRELETCLLAAKRLK